MHFRRHVFSFSWPFPSSSSLETMLSLDHIKTICSTQLIHNSNIVDTIKLNCACVMWDYWLGFPRSTSWRIAVRRSFPQISLALLDIHSNHIGGQEGKREMVKWWKKSTRLGGDWGFTPSPSHVSNWTLVLRIGPSRWLVLVPWRVYLSLTTVCRLSWWNP
jgi:hypothetical protein